MTKAAKEAVAQFLKNFKKVATQGRGIYFVGRAKDKSSWEWLGFTKKNLKEELLSLTVADYCAGPKPDHDQPGEIWEFGKIIEGNEVYIKIKVAKINDEEISKCISFHIAAHRLRFPYR